MSELSSECQKLIPLLDAYFDGELEGDELSGVERHLPGCEPCRLRLTEIESVATSLRNLQRVAPKRDFADDIDKLLGPSKPDVVPAQKAADEKVVSLSARKNNRVLWGSLAVAAAITLVIIAGKVLTGPVNVIAKKGTGDSRQSPSTGKERTPQPQIANQGADRVKSSPVIQPERVARANPTDHKINGKAAERQAPEIALNDRAQPRVAENGGTAQNNRIADNSAVGRHEQTLAVQNVGGGGTASPEVIAMYEAADTPCTEELGLSTDEDGLYALKL